MQASRHSLFKQGQAETNLEQFSGVKSFDRFIDNDLMLLSGSRIDDPNFIPLNSITETEDGITAKIPDIVARGLFVMLKSSNDSQEVMTF